MRPRPALDPSLSHLFGQKVAADRLIAVAGDDDAGETGPGER
jgi:hypothetical protein